MLLSVCLSFALFGNKFLIIQKKKKSPHEGEKESPKMMTSDIHMKPTSSIGSTGLFTSGYASRYPDLFKGVNSGRSLGSYVKGNASATETARRDCVQTTPMFGISRMFTDFGYVPLIHSVRPGEQRTVPKSDGIGSPVKRRFSDGWWSRYEPRCVDWALR